MANNKLPEVAFFATKNGDKSRIYVTPAVYDTLQQAQVGTSLLLSEVPADQKAKAESNGKTAPTHRMVVMPKDENYAPRAQKAVRKTSKSDEL